MSEYDVHCIGGCGTVLGTTDKDPYPGDAYFGYLCDDCAQVEEVISDEPQ